MDLTDIYRVFHPAIVQYAFFSAISGAFSKIDHILGHKASLNKYKKIEITSYILSDNNAMRSQEQKQQKILKYLRVNSKLLHDQWVMEEIWEEIKMYLEFNDNDSTTYQNLLELMGDNKGSPERKVDSHACIY
jgi:hypothetical protein